VLAIRRDLRLITKLKSVEIGVHSQGVFRAEDRRDSRPNLNDIGLRHGIDDIRKHRLSQMQWHNDKYGRQYNNHQAEDQHPLYSVHFAGFCENKWKKDKDYYLVSKHFCIYFIWPDGAPSK